MNKNSRSETLKGFYSTIYKRYDLVNHLFTLGMDKRWRIKTALECRKKKPKTIVDLCCGTGDMVLEIARSVPGKTRIVGYDFSASMLELARIKSFQKGYRNIEFIQGDVAKMPFSDAAYDCITIAFGFRNLTYDNPACDVHLAEIARILKKGGQLFILESAVPQKPIVHFFYKLYLRFILVPLGGVLSGNHKAYAYLAQSSANYFNPSELMELLTRHGFAINFMRTFFFGAASLLSAVRK
jgi:demethylmenaquinone methyltransferase / 2-methoxy-6-polyprenyl-1,4-benzoquinol methylase